MVEADEVSNGATQYFLHKQHAEHVLSRLCELRKREELCDVSIVVDGRSITAHRAVLAASSLYFDAMFTGKMSERTKEKVRLNLMDREAKYLPLFLTSTSFPVLSCLYAQRHLHMKPVGNLALVIYRLTHKIYIVYTFQ